MDKQKHSSNDAYASILSSSAVLVQLLLFVINSLSSVLNISVFFVKKEFIPFITLITIFLSLCLMGVYSFFKKNKYSFSPKKERKLKLKLWQKVIKYLFETNDEQQRFDMGVNLEKKILKSCGFVLFLSVIFFIISTISYSSNQYWLIFTRDSVGYIQTITYMTLWLMTSFILFVWISNEMDIRNRFKEEDLIRNVFESLRGQGYILTSFESVKTIPGNGLKRYVKAKINETEHHFIVNFDGTRIEEEIDPGLVSQLFNPLRQNNNGT